MGTSRAGRQTKKTPTIQRHKATGQAVVCLNGRDHYLGPYGTQAAQAKYHRLIAQWLAHAEPGITPAAGHVETIAELVAAYWPQVNRRYVKHGKPTTEIGCQRLAIRYLMDAHAQTPPDEFGPLALQEIRRRMIADNLARGTINAWISRIRRAFKWAASVELIDAAIPHRLATVEGLRRGRGGRESLPRRPVAWPAVAAIEHHVARQVWAMVNIQWHTGMRSQALCGLTTADLDMTGPIWLYRPAGHKTEHHGRESVIAIGPHAQAAITPWLRTDLDAPLFQPAEAVAELRARQIAQRQARRGTGNHKNRIQNPRPRRPAGSAYTTDSYRRAVCRGCAAAEIAPWSPHRLRHSFATRVRRQFGLDAARAALGHADANVTLDYAELDLAKATDVASRIG